MARVHLRMGMFGLAAAAALGSRLWAVEQETPQAAPRSKPATLPASPPGKTPEDPDRAGDGELVQMIQVVGEPANVDELLDALESADKGIQTFQAGIRYDRQFILQGDRHVRLGELYFRVDPAKGAGRVRRTFSISFSTLYIDDTVREDPSTWAFDGEWLIERRPREKSFVKRRISTPEDPVDPLGLGESPIPFPIGQRKAAILERYTATMPKIDDGLAMDPADAKDDPEGAEEAAGLLKVVEGTYQLRLVPRGAYADQDEFREIRLWYARDTFVPRMARAVNRQGDVSVIQMINIKLNQPLPKHAISTEPPSEPGWDIQIDEGRVK